MSILDEIYIKADCLRDHHRIVKCPLERCEAHNDNGKCMSICYRCWFCAKSEEEFWDLEDCEWLRWDELEDLSPVSSW